LSSRGVGGDQAQPPATSSGEIDTKAAFRHPNREKWRKGVECMERIAELRSDDKNAKLIHQAQYNLGKAYFQGFGVKQSDDRAEKYWLMAADDGSAQGSISAMTALAFFYSRKTDPQCFDLNKTLFWHNQACGNGSLESQGKSLVISYILSTVSVVNLAFKLTGALGAMYYFGIGCKKDMQAAYECLTDSSERGNVYSMGILCDYYYRNKFYIKADDLSKK
jgi:TPR repeat protein